MTVMTGEVGKVGTSAVTLSKVNGERDADRPGTEATGNGDFTNVSDPFPFLNDQLITRDLKGTS